MSPAPMSPPDGRMPGASSLGEPGTAPPASIAPPPAAMPPRAPALHGGSGPIPPTPTAPTTGTLSTDFDPTTQAIVHGPELYSAPTTAPPTPASPATPAPAPAAAPAASPEPTAPEKAGVEAVRPAPPAPTPAPSGDEDELRQAREDYERSAEEMNVGDLIDPDLLQRLREDAGLQSGSRYPRLQAVADALREASLAINNPKQLAAEKADASRTQSEALRTLAGLSTQMRMNRREILRSRVERLEGLEKQRKAGEAKYAQFYLPQIKQVLTDANKTGVTLSEPPSLDAIKQDESLATLWLQDAQSRVAQSNSANVVWNDKVLPQWQKIAAGGTSTPEEVASGVRAAGNALFGADSPLLHTLVEPAAMALRGQAMQQNSLKGAITSRLRAQASGISQDKDIALQKLALAKEFLAESKFRDYNNAMNQATLQQQKLGTRLQELGALVAMYRAGTTPDGKSLSVEPGVLQQAESSYFEAQRQFLDLQSQTIAMQFQAGKLGAADTQPQTMVSGAVAELSGDNVVKTAIDKILLVPQMRAQFTDPAGLMVGLPGMLAWYAQPQNKVLARRLGVEKYFVYLGNRLNGRAAIMTPPDQVQGVLSDITGKAAGEALKNDPAAVQNELTAGDQDASAQGTPSSDVDQAMSHGDY